MNIDETTLREINEMLSDKEFAEQSANLMKQVVNEYNDKRRNETIKSLGDFLVSIPSRAVVEIRPVNETVTAIELTNASVIYVSNECDITSENEFFVIEQ